MHAFSHGATDAVISPFTFTAQLSKITFQLSHLKTKPLWSPPCKTVGIARPGAIELNPMSPRPCCESASKDFSGKAKVVEQDCGLFAVCSVCQVSSLRLTCRYRTAVSHVLSLPFENLHVSYLSNYQPSLNRCFRAVPTRKHACNQLQLSFLGQDACSSRIQCLPA